VPFFEAAFQRRKCVASWEKSIPVAWFVEGLENENILPVIESKIW
jgi:hypothetical protein